jgi:ABC-2 type transport system ATP-binding protein
MIRLTNVAARKKGGAAVSGVSFEVDEGVLAIVGPAEPLFDVLDGTLRPERGDVERGARVFRVSHDAPLPEALSVEEACAFARRVRREAPRSAHETLGVLGIASYAKRRIASLTREQRRTVTFAIALASELDLLLVEEPLAFLSPEAPSRVGEALRRCRARVAILATASRRDAEALADRTLVMDRGALVAAPALATRAMRVTLEPASAASLAAFLARDPNVSHLESQPGTVTVSGGDPDALARAITHAVATLGVAVHRIERSRA